MAGCRCGWLGIGDHPCHGQGYTCKKPAQERWVVLNRPFALAGVQAKAQVSSTWACEECWAWYQQYMAGTITEAQWLEGPIR